jgi:hypothetical protein
MTGAPDSIGSMTVTRGTRMKVEQGIPEVIYCLKSLSGPSLFHVGVFIAG